MKFNRDDNRAYYWYQEPTLLVELLAGVNVITATFILINEVMDGETRHIYVRAFGGQAGNLLSGLTLSALACTNTCTFFGYYGITNTYFYRFSDTG